MPVLMFTFYSSRVACNIIGMGNCCYILYGRFCKNLMNEVYNGSHAFFVCRIVSMAQSENLGDCVKILIFAS
ncbi:hypothetical protein E5353_14730 [Bacteroides caecimuris]|uniref:Uncharacterized protein n=1 Tax=Bacteroides caecimuris TaxID=1796613 RepID=A0A4S2CQA4_9BACE|nr:hypothetical protein E5353_14730 [Bacteroides caecimuris]